MTDHQTMIEWTADLMQAAEDECRRGNPDAVFQLAAWQVADCLRELLTDRQELAHMRAEYGDAVKEKALKGDLVRGVRHLWLSPGETAAVEDGEPVVIVARGPRLSLLDQVDPIFGGHDAPEIVAAMGSRR